MQVQHTGVRGLRIGPELAEAVSKLRRAGGRVWLVGGTVRDAILELQRVDWDVATDLPPDRVLDLLDGEAEQSRPELGTVRAKLDRRDTVWTTLRIERDYGPDRRPRSVRFGASLEEDARRRDFTINAIYAELPGLELLDPCGGLEDLDARLLRAIGDPVERLREDPLRVLRGVRFAAGFGLAIESGTRRGLRAAAPACATLAPERVREEVERALIGPGRGRAFLLLCRLGVVDRALPELAGRSAAQQLSVAWLLEDLPDGERAALWAAVSGEPDVAERMLGRLGAAKSLRARVSGLLRWKHRLEGWGGKPFAQRREVLAESWLAGAETFLEAWSKRRGLDPSRYETLIEDRRRMRSVGEGAPFVRGTDVVEAGLPAGPAVGEVLAKVRQAARDGRIADRGGALELVRRLAAERVKERGETGR